MSVIESSTYNPTDNAALLYAQPEARRDLEFKMLHNQVARVDTQLPGIYEPEEIGLSTLSLNNEKATIVAEFGIPVSDNQQLEAAVIKITQEDGLSRYVIGGLEKDQSGKSILNGKWAHISDDGEEVILGRSGDSKDSTPTTIVGANDLWNVPLFGEQASRKHLGLKLQGSELVIKDSSVNGTYVKIQQSELLEHGDKEHIANHTMSAEELARLRGVLTENTGVNGTEKLFAGRPVISRDTFPIEGAVDIRSWVGGGEAIVVDSKKDPEAYQKLSDACWQRIIELQKNGGANEKVVLQAIFDTVSSAMKYDLKHVNKTSTIVAKQNNLHRKINLSEYLRDGKGVCRQMALAASWLGGDMQKKGLLKGRLTAEVNQRVKDNAAHEWARYTSNSGDVTIIDPAQNFIGTLKDTLTDGKKGKERWEYFRDGEKQKYQAMLIGSLAVQKSEDPEGKKRWWRN